MTKVDLPPTDVGSENITRGMAVDEVDVRYDGRFYFYFYILLM